MPMKKLLPQSEIQKTQLETTPTKKQLPQSTLSTDLHLLSEPSKSSRRPKQPKPEKVSLSTEVSTPFDATHIAHIARNAKGGYEFLGDIPTPVQQAFSKHIHSTTTISPKEAATLYNTSVSRGEPPRSPRKGIITSKPPPHRADKKKKSKKRLKKTLTAL